MNDLSNGTYKQTYEATDNPGREDEGYKLIYPWKFLTKQSFSPGNSSNLCYTHWKFQGQNPISLVNLHDFFLITVLFFFNEPLEILHAHSYDAPRNFKNNLLLLCRLYYCDR